MKEFLALSWTWRYFLTVPRWNREGMKDIGTNHCECHLTLSMVWLLSRGWWCEQSLAGESCGPKHSWTEGWAMCTHRGLTALASGSHRALLQWSSQGLSSAPWASAGSAQIQPHPDCWGLWGLGREKLWGEWSAEIGEQSWWGAGDPCLRESAWISAGSFKCQSLNPLALVGTTGGFRSRREEEENSRKRLGGWKKVIKGENTEQKAKQKGDPASPQSCWCSSSPGCAHTLSLACLCSALTAGCCWPHERTQHFWSGKTENEDVTWVFGFFGVKLQPQPGDLGPGRWLLLLTVSCSEEHLKLLQAQSSRCSSLNWPAPWNLNIPSWDPMRQLCWVWQAEPTALTGLCLALVAGWCW